MSKLGRPQGIVWGKTSCMREGEDIDPSSPHPGDAIDGVEAQELEAHLSSLGDKQDAADLFRRLFITCLPAKGYMRRMGGRAHWQAGYHRMVAIAYHLTPEAFDGMTPQEVASTLGVSWWAFRKQLRAVRDMLDARQAAAARRRRNR